MKTLITTAVIVAALTLPSLAETTGTEAAGEANGSVRASTQEREALIGQIAMARGTILQHPGATARADASGSTALESSSGAEDSGVFFKPASSGMDGGNRK